MHCTTMMFKNIVKQLIRSFCKNSKKSIFWSKTTISGVVTWGHRLNWPPVKYLFPPNFEWNQEKMGIFLYKVVKTDDFLGFCPLKNILPPLVPPGEKKLATPLTTIHVDPSLTTSINQNIYGALSDIMLLSFTRSRIKNVKDHYTALLSKNAVSANIKHSRYFH